MILLFFAASFATIFAGWRVWRRIRFFLHVYQLESYKPRRYVKWVLTRSTESYCSRITFDSNTCFNRVLVAVQSAGRNLDSGGNSVSLGGVFCLFPPLQRGNSEKASCLYEPNETACRYSIRNCGCSAWGRGNTWGLE